MKQTLYAVLVMSGLLNSAYAMEAVTDDDVANPKGLLSCCVGRVRSAHAPAADVGLTNFREDDRCPGCSVDDQLSDSAARKAVATVALFHGVANNNLTCMLQHLGEGADVNAKDKTGCTPIECAIRDRNTEVAAVLLAVDGIDITSTSTQGDTLEQLVSHRRDSATELQQNECDELLLYLRAKREGVFPYSVQEHRLVNTLDKKMLLSSQSLEGSRLQGRSSVELASLLRDIIQQKETKAAVQSLDQEVE